MLICPKVVDCSSGENRREILAFAQRQANRHHHWLTMKVLSSNGVNVLWSKIVRPQ